MRNWIALQCFVQCLAIIERYAMLSESTKITRSACTIIYAQAQDLAQRLDHITTKVGEITLARVGVTAFELVDVKVHEPSSRVELGVDGLDAEVVLVAGGCFDGFHDHVADDGLEIKLALLD